MNNKPITFTCFAGCVTRDVFRFLDEEKISPTNSIGFVTISASNCQSFKINSEFLHIGANYEKRNLIIDVEKSIGDAIDKKTTDWFMFDIISERFPIMKFSCEDENGNKLYGYGTETQCFLDNFANMQKQNFYKNLKKERSFVGEELFDELDYENSIKAFCKLILSKFPANQIIFNEVDSSEYYLDKEKVLRRYNDPGARQIRFDYNNFYNTNPLYEKIAKIIKQNMPGIHVIKMPRCSISDASHWWNLNPLHFQSTYYQYLADCIKTILYEKDLSVKEEKLDLLYENQSRNNELSFEILKQNAYDLKTLASQKSSLEMAQRWQVYSNCFKSLINSFTHCRMGGGYSFKEIS